MGIPHRPIDQLLSRLRLARRSNGGWQAQCPAHDDRTPSLSIKESADGTILIKCFAGCSAAAIVTAIGLSLRDLFPTRNGGHKTSAGKHEPTAVYSYVDEAGTLLFQTLRYEWYENGRKRKSFRQRRPDGQGGWIYNLGQTRRVLYRLPRVLQTIEACDTVFIVEGEKDVETLERIGFTATTNPMGAGKWRDEFNAVFHEAHVVLIPDNDEAGFQHMEHIARRLHGHAAGIQILSLPGLPTKGDVSDWLAQSGTREALERLIIETPQYIPSPAEEPADRFDAYRPFPADVLPEPVRSFVATAAEAIGCDPSFIALPLLAALAAAIGNTRRIQLKRSWTEPAVLWTVVVSESGTLKSPAFDLALRPLKRKQSEALKQHEAKQQEHQAELLRYEAALADWKKHGRKAGEEPPPRPEEPRVERFYCSDITIEALAVLLKNAPRGLLVARDELSGWLKGFNQYKKTGGDEAHWLELHRAGTLLVDRKTGDTRTIYVPCAAASITGSIQPKILGEALGRTYFENGLAARLLFSMPPHYPKHWSEAEVDPALETRIEALFDRLLRLDFCKTSYGDAEPVLIPLTSNGRAAWITFYNGHAQEQIEILDSDLTAAWSKLEGYAARLALVIHYVRWAAGDPDLTDGTAVDEQSIAAGVALSQWFGQEARRVYAVLAESPEERALRELVDLIQRKGGRITIRELMRSSRRYKDAARTEEQLLRLIERGLITEEPPSSPARSGRPQRVFTLKPIADADKSRQNPPKSSLRKEAADKTGVLSAVLSTRENYNNSHEAKGLNESHGGFVNVSTPESSDHPLSSSPEAFVKAVSPASGDIEAQVRTWPKEWQKEWDRRTTIIEFENGLFRAEAERLAFESVSKAKALSESSLKNDFEEKLPSERER